MFAYQGRNFKSKQINVVSAKILKRKFRVCMYVCAKSTAVILNFVQSLAVCKGRQCCAPQQADPGVCAHHSRSSASVVH